MLNCSYRNDSPRQLKVICQTYQYSKIYLKKKKTILSPFCNRSNLSCFPLFYAFLKIMINKGM